MRISALLLFFFLLSISSAGQNLIGYSTKEVKEYLSKQSPELIEERNFTNDHYRYLKFTDGNLNLKTLIIFFSDKNRCTGVKIIYDLSLKNKVVKELDSLYVRKEENIWLDRDRKKTSLVELTREDWFITVSIKPVKK